MHIVVKGEGLKGGARSTFILEGGEGWSLGPGYTLTKAFIHVSDVLILGGEGEFPGPSLQLHVHVCTVHS